MQPTQAFLRIFLRTTKSSRGVGSDEEWKELEKATEKLVDRSDEERDEEVEDLISNASEAESEEEEDDTQSVDSDMDAERRRNDEELIDEFEDIEKCTPIGAFDEELLPLGMEDRTEACMLLSKVCKMYYHVHRSKKCT